MPHNTDIKEYVQSLVSSKRLGSQVVYHKILPDQPARLSQPKHPWPEPIRRIITTLGIGDLYRHQADAVDLIRSGRHVVIATPTASGKTLIYNLPMMEKILKNPNSRALYIFPLKALAQDQLRTFEALSRNSREMKPTIAIYDGDTSAWYRKRIREIPPNI
jgi:DEAD/DEAH box helicase domain-containing protein